METPQSLRKGWRIGRLSQVDVVVAYSTPLILLLLAVFWSISREGTLTAAEVAHGAGLGALIVVAVFLHELGHLWAVRALGREVDEIVFSLVATHTSWDQDRLTPRVEGLAAAAGPLMNGVIGVAFWGAMRLDLPTGVEQAFGWFVFMNLFLMAYNLLPVFSTDGGRVLAAIVWARTGRRSAGFRATGRASIISIPVFMGGILFLARDSRFSFDFWVLMGLLFSLLIWQGARCSFRMARIIELTEGISVEKMMHTAVGVPFEATVAEALALAIAAGADEVVVVAAGGRTAGHFAIGSAQEVPEALREKTGLLAVTLPIPPGAEVAFGQSGHELLANARAWWGKSDTLAVIDEGEIVGVIRLEEVWERFK